MSFIITDILMTFFLVFILNWTFEQKRLSKLQTSSTSRAVLGFRGEAWLNISEQFLVKNVEIIFETIGFVLNFQSYIFICINFIAKSVYLLELVS